MLLKNKKEGEEDEFKLGLKKFKSELSKRKKDVLLLFLGTLCIYVPISFTTLLQGKILDALIHPKEIYFFNFGFNSLYWFVGIFIFISFFWRAVALYVYTYKTQILSNEIFKDYAKNIFSTIISYPVSFFKTQQLGEIIYSLNTGIDTLSRSMIKMVVALGKPLAMLFNLFFLFYLNWKVGFVMLFGSLVYIMWLKKTIKERKKVSAEFNEAKKNINAKLTESLNFAIEIKKNLKEKKEYERLRFLMQGEYSEKFEKKLYFNLFNSAVSRFIFTLTIIASMLITIFQYKTGSLSEGSVLSILIYSFSTMRNISWFMSFFNEYIESFTVIGDTEKLLLRKTEEYSKKNIKNNVLGEIEFKDVDFDYGDEDEDEKNKPELLDVDKKKKKEEKFSLKKINLKIEKGQKVAFVGESGGGKSTAIELIGGFYFPTQGEVYVDGVTTRNWNLKALRSSIAYVSQDIAIFNSTIAENISYGALREVSVEEIKEAAKLAFIDEYIEKLPDKYDTKVGERGLKISGGQRQRIAIARAILRNPKILILDEPTSALDIKSETYITASLKKLMKGRTTLVIAHRLSTVRDSDKIFVFKGGKIVEEGTYEELERKNGEFKMMVELSEGLQ